jgi:RNA polymerase sigma factor (sigma-70 family)
LITDPESITCYSINGQNYDRAFQKLFETHHATVYNHAYRMTASSWHSEEIAQDVFLRVWIHREKIASIKDMESWLFIMTKRFVVDYIRKKCRQQQFYTSYK